MATTNPHSLRAHADAIRAANMKAEGYTSRQIAESLGKKSKQIKGIVLLGQRLIAERSPAPKEEP